jgi:CRP-like cAMP-binding protein
LRELAERCPDLRLRAGQEFYRPGEQDGGLLLIKEGRVRVYLITPTGKEVREHDYPWWGGHNGS